MTTGNTRFFLKRKCEQICNLCLNILSHLQWMMTQLEKGNYATHKAMVMKLAEITMMLHDTTEQFRRMV